MPGALLPQARLSELLAWATGQIGVPYLWGGRGAFSTRNATDGLFDSTYIGFDCWGFVSCALLAAGGPDLRLWWTDRAWAELEPVAVPAPGVAAFFWTNRPTGPQDVEHVELLVEPAPLALLAGSQTALGGWKTIAARGGDHTTLTLDVAQAQRAQVMYRNSHLQRARFAGFRRLPVG